MVSVSFDVNFSLFNENWKEIVSPSLAGCIAGINIFHEGRVAPSRFDLCEFGRLGPIKGLDKKNTSHGSF